MYSIRKSNKKDADVIFNYSYKTYFQYNDVDEEEKQILTSIIKHNINENIFNYNMIIMDNKIVGMYLFYEYNDGILLDDIYIEEEYRNKYIGSNIIKDLQKNHIIYLNVYKSNKKAISLYEKLDFKIIDDKLNRYQMKSDSL